MKRPMEQATAKTNTARGPAEWATRVERGPDWLFVRLEAAANDAPSLTEPELADAVWGMLRANQTHRVVLELDSVQSLDEGLIDAIVNLGTRVRKEGGLIRVCGLKEPNLAKLRACHRAELIPHFGSVPEAVGSRRTDQPR